VSIIIDRAICTDTAVDESNLTGDEVTEHSRCILLPLSRKL
jgi:hypothetical protein